MTQGAVNWHIDRREQITPDNWHDVLSAENTFVVLVKNSRIAVAKAGIQSAIHTGHMRAGLVELAGSYVAQTLAQHPDALYYLGELYDAAHDEMRTYIALDFDVLTDDTAHSVVTTFVSRALMQYDWPIFRFCIWLVISASGSAGCNGTGIELVAQ